MSDFNLKTTLQQLLQQGDTITLKWDCGGDEALIYIQYNNKPISEDRNAPKWVDALCMHLLNTIGLPSAGEFSMDGKGEILVQNQQPCDAGSRSLTVNRPQMRILLARLYRLPTWRRWRIRRNLHG